MGAFDSWKGPGEVVASAGYSNSELIRGRASEARALASISACSHPSAGVLLPLS